MQYSYHAGPSISPSRLHRPTGADKASLCASLERHQEVAKSHKKPQITGIAEEPENRHIGNHDGTERVQLVSSSVQPI